MGGMNSTLQKKSEKQIHQVLQVKFLVLYNAIEITYDDDRDGV